MQAFFVRRFSTNVIRGIDRLWVVMTAPSSAT
jgi:hypothetical protein